MKKGTLPFSLVLDTTGSAADNPAPPRVVM